MTNNVFVLSVVAGAFLILNGIFNIFAHHIGRKHGIGLKAVSIRTGVQTPISGHTASLVGLPKTFLYLSWGAILLTCAEEVVGTRLGAITCVVIAAYLGVEFYALRIKEVKGPPIFVDVIFSVVPAVCLAIAATFWFVT